MERRIEVFKRVLAFEAFAVLLAMCGTRPCCSSLADEPKPRMAALGADSRIPTAEEIKAYGLNRLVECANGQYVTTIHKGATAEKAGIREGDVLLSLNANKLYSGDDLQDFLRVMRPGTIIEARVKRAGNFKQENVTLTLGTGWEKLGQGIVWQYAGPGQLDSAIAAAKNEGRFLLVGLSGADT
jgi:predicted metalloprotease with PDZ domain